MAVLAGCAARPAATRRPEAISQVPAAEHCTDRKAEPCTCPAPTEPADQVEPEPELALEPIEFAEVPGWTEDSLAEAVPALLRSCARLGTFAADRPIGPDGLAGTAGDWRDLCSAARGVRGDQAARRFFEKHFAVYLASDRGDDQARFTGYYEALMRGARKKGGAYQWPIYRRPPELVMVHLDDWHQRANPRRVAGMVKAGRLHPYYTRKQIADGALAGRGLELFWVTDPVDAFFAQIQGSGIVELPGGKRVRVGYAGKNGHTYTAIGRVLIARGELTPAEMSMQAIRSWLDDHPGQVHELLNQNEAFVFFEAESRPGAIGAQSVVLTPERSVAIDPRYIPLSAPLFVVTEVPDPDAPERFLPWRKLVIAQDTGGAIRGPTRGDLFFGAGERAFAMAGRLKSIGRTYLLLPRTVTVSRAPLPR